MKEDRLTNALIKMHKQFAENKATITPEAHYNHYGTRGIADLYVHSKYREKNMIKTEADVYEVKSNPQNANQVVRQFNKMCKYFYKGSDKIKPDKVRFHLTFTAEPSNLKHVLENKEIYRSVAKKEGTVVTFRHPENITPVHILTPVIEIGDEKWLEHVKAVGHEENLDTEEVRKLVEVV